MSKYKTRVGLIHYSKDAVAVQSLRDSNTKDTTISRIERMTYASPGSNLLLTLQKADEMFRPGNGERSDAKKVMILFVDSLRDSDVAVLERMVSSLKRRKVRIVVVGFKSYVQPSPVKMLLGSGRYPVLIGDAYKLSDGNIVSQVISQLGKGSTAYLLLLCMA